MLTKQQKMAVIEPIRQVCQDWLNMKAEPDETAIDHIAGLYGMLALQCVCGDHSHAYISGTFTGMQTGQATSLLRALGIIERPK